MATFILFVIIVVIVIAVIQSKRKKKAALTALTPTSTVGSRQQSTSSAGVNDPIVLEVERTLMQVLETTHIIGTSKALDTVQGRYQFLTQILPGLKAASTRPQYQLFVQRALDHYKSVYYNTMPQDFQLAIVLKPADFNVAEFYCKSLAMTFKRFFEEQVEAIKLLKKEDAKKRRLSKIREVLQSTKSELAAHCSGVVSYADVVAALDALDERLQGGDTTSGNEKSLIESSTPVTASSVTSISRKGSSAEAQDVVLNAKTSLPLTLVKVDKTIANRIKTILDSDAWEGQKRDQITALFAEYNLVVKEIEAYRAKYAPVYNAKLDELKAASTEWQSANELDREDLLTDMRPVALRALYERANCDLPTLFECEPADVTADDALIREYGFESFETYLRFADKLDKVRIVPNDNYNREKFVRLVEIGLAIRGSAIPIAEILNGLTLKTLNEIASHPDKEFKRKNLAVDFILAKDGYEDLVSSKVALLELFKLQPLPDKFSDVDIKAIASSWKYTYTVVELFVHSYLSGADARRKFKDFDFAKSFTIENYTEEQERCPRAKEYHGKAVAKGSGSPVPCHVGCNCELRPVFR